MVSTDEPVSPEAGTNVIHETLDALVLEAMAELDKSDEDDPLMQAASLIESSDVPAALRLLRRARPDLYAVRISACISDCAEPQARVPKKVPFRTHHAAGPAPRLHAQEANFCGCSYGQWAPHRIG
jgi:hypothetical protein